MITVLTYVAISFAVSLAVCLGMFLIEKLGDSFCKEDEE